MANKKITELPNATLPITTGVKFEAVQGGQNVQVDADDMPGSGGGAVDSVNGQTGVVVIDAGDISFTPAGTISATDVQAAIEELDTEKQAALVSGTNIKTVNGTSILGSGDIDLIDDAIVNGEAKAPSQNAVFDALALKADITYVDTQVATKYDFLISLRTLTASHTLDSTDLASVNAGDQLVIRQNVGSANSVEIPLNATVAFPTGTIIGIRNINTGVVTITAAIGVTLNAPISAFKLNNQYDMAYIEKVGTNEWVANGQLGL